MFDESKLDVLLLVLLLPIFGDACPKAKLVKGVDIISENKDKEPRISNNVFPFFILQLCVYNVLFKLLHKIEYQKVFKISNISS